MHVLGPVPVYEPDWRVLWILGNSRTCYPGQRFCDNFFGLAAFTRPDKICVLMNDQYLLLRRYGDLLFITCINTKGGSMSCCCKFLVD